MLKDKNGSFSFPEQILKRQLLIHITEITWKDRNINDITSMKKSECYCCVPEMTQKSCRIM